VLHKNLFFYLLILTGFFMLLECSYFIQCNSAYLSDYTFVSRNLSIPLSILPGILSFIGTQIVVHLVYCFILWVVIEYSYTFLKPIMSNQFHYAISLWILSAITFLIANQIYFPNSKFAELTALIFFNPAITKIAFVVFAGCFSITVLLALIALLNRLTLGLSVLAILAGYFILTFPSTQNYFVATSSRPNIILVGIDSLRPDFLGYFGSERKTPFLDSMLEQSTVFAEAVTPLARTFPSWTSLLTGQYPRETHIRSNLATQQALQVDTTLPSILQRNGYETIYATDETRFSNIDKNFGFDRIISPPMGLNDFLIGNFNDFPLSNLVINTVVGKWLFPYSYANRPVHFAYNPNSFLNLLKPSLAEKREKPLFLAVHFCLTHSPYLWASLSGENVSVQERYVASINRVDEQIRDFFVLLQEYHLLDHAMVVLLSDHGEALEFSGDRITEKELYLPSTAASSAPKFYPQGLLHEEMNQSAGHGTDVMGLPQYHSLLAFRLYGAGDYQTGNIAGVVSLLDIKPTLLSFLQLSAPNSSGISLLKWIQKNQPTQLPARHIFIESDYSPTAIRTVYPEERQVMLEGIELFEINPLTTRLTVRNEMTAKIIGSKQYADIYEEWMLALYPQDKNTRMPILVNLNTGVWTNDLQSVFAQHSPAQLMLAKLRAFYGDEIAGVM